MKKRIEAALLDRHADLRQRARVDTTLLPWEASPSGTVWRQPLYRVGGEHGPVTSQGNRIKNRNYLKIFVFKYLHFLVGNIFEPNQP